MASLKDEIEAAALRIGSRGGMPADKSEITIDSSVTSYVAPCDGFAFMRCSTNGSGKIAINASGLNMFWQLDVGGDIKIPIFVPVAKGQEIFFMTYREGVTISQVAKNKEIEELREQLIKKDIDCLRGAVMAQGATLNEITKTIVPKSAICPEFMNRYNSWAAPTTPASGA